MQKQKGIKELQKSFSQTILVNTSMSHICKAKVQGRREERAIALASNKARGSDLEHKVVFILQEMYIYW